MSATAHETPTDPYQLESDYRHAVLAPMRAAREKHSGVDWFVQHMRAWHATRPGYERAIANALNAMADYAAAYESQHGSGIGTDGVLGEAFADQLRGWLALLNGERGRLDGGLLDAAARSLWTRAGFEGEL
jgi:hypothetical protein